MADVEFKADQPLKKRRFRPLDVIIAVVIVIVVGLLLHGLLSQISLKHEASAARRVTDQMILDIQKQNASDARKLGDAAFQSQNSTASLTSQFKVVDSFVSGAASRDHTTVTNDKSGQAVSVIYKYSGKHTFYVRVIVTKPKGASAWHVVNIKGNTKESLLLNNAY